jgi:glycosyltransferase involved in cell wall biosynthesis
MSREMPDPCVEITLVICTYDRRDSLLETLETVATQAATNAWEVLVVDNNSSDGTAEQVEARAGRFPVPLRVVREDRQGRSFALNHAIDAARGEILIFTDDDVNLRPGFIAAHAAAYADPAVAGVGGRIVPIMPENTPPWMLAMAEGASGGLTGLYDFGDELREIDPGAGMLLPFGANMSLRREVLRKLGGFRTDLGWGRTFVPGEESDVFGRLRSSGGRIVYQPDAVVEHRFQASKATLAYYLKFEAGCGRALVLMTEFTPAQRIRRIFREALNLAVFSGKAFFGPREMSVRLGNLRRSAQARGKLAQLLGL